jgi:hypothetical protein
VAVGHANPQPAFSPPVQQPLPMDSRFSKSLV